VGSKTYSKEDLDKILALYFRRTGEDGTDRSDSSYSEENIMQMADEMNLDKAMIKRVANDYSLDKISEEERIALMDERERKKYQRKKSLDSLLTKLGNAWEGIRYRTRRAYTKIARNPELFVPVLIGGLVVVALGTGITVSVQNSVPPEPFAENATALYQTDLSEADINMQSKMILGKAIKYHCDYSVTARIITSATNEYMQTLNQTGFSVADGIKVMAAIDKHADFSVTADMLVDSSSRYVKALHEREQSATSGISYLKTVDELSSFSLTASRLVDAAVEMMEGE